MDTEVVDALRAIFGAFIPLQSARGAGRMFELFVEIKIAEGLMSRGWAVELQSSNGRPIGSGGMFIQRGGAPGGVIPASRGVYGPSSIVISMPGRDEWEIWNGIQFCGRSYARHEIDIAIVPRQLAINLRRAATETRPFGRPRVAVECKDVACAGSADEMRALIARLYDVTLIQWHHGAVKVPMGQVAKIYDSPPPIPGYVPPPAPGYGKAAASLRQENQRTCNVLARRGGFSQGALSMTALYRIKTYCNVGVGTPEAGALVNDVCDWIDANLR